MFWYLHALVAAREPVAIDQVLPNARRVASPFKLQRDDLRIGLTGAERALHIRA